MRPRRLVVEGLRSFRNRVEIDFGDRHLVAVVGDTGVGKSSILEAITYALYGGATWTDRHGDLISDTADDMLVELDFDVDGKSYTVRRTASKKSRPSTAQLQGPDDKVVDDVRPVHSAVVKLVGLDREALLKTVILPQGKFAELLHATPGERNEVLKGIFRVDVLEAVSDHAKTIADRLSPQVQGLQQRRAAFPPDPRAAVAEAERAEGENAAAADHLAQLLTTAEGLEKSRSAAENAAEAVRKAMARLDAEAAPELSRRIQELLGRANELDAERQSLEADKALIEGQLSELQARRREATTDGLDTTELAKAHATLGHIVDELPPLSETIGRLREDELELVGLAGQLDPLPEEAEEAQREAERAAEAAGRASEERRRAERAMKGAETLLGHARMAAGLASEAYEAVAASTIKLDSAGERQQEADCLAEEPLRRHQAAQSALEHLRRQHSAAHAAQAAGPADPCPVCTRELPPDFCAPIAPAMEAAIAEAGEAEQALNETRGEVLLAGQAVEGAEGRLSEATIEQSRRQEELAQAVSELAHHLQVAGQGIDLAADDEVVLASLQDVLTEAEEAEKKTAEAAEIASEVARDAWDAERRLREKLETKRHWLDETYERAEKSLVRLTASVSLLPDSLRSPLPRSDELETVEVDAFDPRPFEAMANTLQDRLEQLQDLDRRLQEARHDEGVIRESLAGLGERYATDVTQPALAVRSDVVLLAERLGESASILRAGFEPISVSMDPDLARLGDVVGELGERQGALLAHGRETARGYDSTSREADTKLQAVLRETRADDVDALREQAMDAKVGAKAAKQKLSEAKEAAEKAEMLDRRLGLGNQLVDDLERLRDQLGRGQRGFIAHLIGRRAEALLGVAGQHLSEMTGGRYAFMADFEILDQLTGLPRNAKTLSGGESFLASLALALGMVDLAARAGGRLDALFLDEGFGALDATNLNSAIDALEATAQSGRMVGVISHVRAVAERIDDVMAVKAAPDGSEVFWLDDPERAGLTQQDAAAALAGLLD